MHLTKNQQKLIRSLNQKKNRDDFGLFVAEGNKIICDLIKSNCLPLQIYANSVWMDENSKKDIFSQVQFVQVNTSEMERISHLTTPSDVLAIFPITRCSINDFLSDKSLPIIYLDDIKDPGNLGTIIRTADWFGIKHIACSHETVDCYNPKVVQATMGSIARIKTLYVDSNAFFNHIPSEYDIIGAFMNGESIHEYRFRKQSIIVIGNEGKGISEKTQHFIKNKISIPKIYRPSEENSIESLNASVACSIICFEFSKQFLK